MFICLFSSALNLSLSFSLSSPSSTLQLLYLFLEGDD
jgi:hypothetical protein